MKLLCCHPSGLMYTNFYLRLEPLGVELVAQPAMRAGHDVRILDLQIFPSKKYFHEIRSWRPDAIGFSLNYLANIPEVLTLAKQTKELFPDVFLFVGGHSASFTAQEILDHAQGAIDCIVKGEAEEIIPRLLEAACQDRKRVHSLPGVLTCDGEGPAPRVTDDLDRFPPAHGLLPKRGKYFIGRMDPCASVEFTRGCPWNCMFCSAWIFYGRSYRKRHPEAIARELESLTEPHIFVVDDVAFLDPEHGWAIGKEIEKRKVRKRYYMETRADVLLKNKDVFQYWKTLGLSHLFVGLEAIDEGSLKSFRKGVSLSRNWEALQFARSLGIVVAVNVIASPAWEEEQFQAVREWAWSVPEVVNISVETPYPGTEIFLARGQALSTRDYRLFDIQHAVLPTKLPLKNFYQELIQTQQVLNRKHLGLRNLIHASGIAAKFLLKGKTNFVKMLFNFNRVYNPARLLAEHQRDLEYEMRIPQVDVNNMAEEIKRLYVLRSD